MNNQVWKKSMVAAAALMVASCKAPVKNVEGFFKGMALPVSAETMGDFSAEDFEAPVSDNESVSDTEKEDAVYTMNTVVIGEGGSIATERFGLGILGYGQAKAGDLAVAHVHNERGYDVKNVTITDAEGNELFSGSRYECYFTMPEGDVTITAEFAPDIDEEEEEAAEAVYVSDDIEEAAETVSVSEDKEDAVYTINTVTNGHGRVSTERFALGILPYGQAKAGDSVVATVANDSGYDVKSVVVTDQDNNTIYSGSGYKFSFKMPEGDVTINVEFAPDIDEEEEEAAETVSAVETNKAEKAEHTMNTVIIGEGGSVATERFGLGTLGYGKAKAGDLAVAHVHNVRGYDVKNVTISDAEGNVLFSGSRYECYFTMPDSDVTITVEFEVDDYAYKKTANIKEVDVNGQVTSMEVDLDDYSVPYEEVDGYDIVGWRINGKDVFEDSDDADAMIMLLYGLDHNAEITVETIYEVLD